MEPRYVFNFILLGNPYVGKTAIIRRFCSDAFSDINTGASIGPNLQSRILTVRQKKIELRIWDTPGIAGTRRFQPIFKSCYRDALGILVVYDVTRPDTVEDLRIWQQQIQNNADENVQVILVGNKNDVDGKRLVSKETGESWARAFGADHIETSAKYRTNIEEVFKSLAEKVLDNFEPSDIAKRSKEEKPWLELRDSTRVDEVKAKKGGCC